MAEVVGAMAVNFLFSYVTSQAVTRITGNEKLGLVAGMAVGIGMSDAITSGSLSSEIASQEAGSTGTTAATDSAAAGTASETNVTLVDDAAAMENTNAQAAVQTEMATPPPETATMTASDTAAPGVQATTAAPMPEEPGILDKLASGLEDVGSWVEKNPEKSNMLVKGLLSALDDSKTSAEVEADALAAKTEEERRQFDLTHQAVNPNNMGSLASVNAQLTQAGYNPVSARVQQVQNPNVAAPGVAPVGNGVSSASAQERLLARIRRAQV